jgi:hypothetical protein
MRFAAVPGFFLALIVTGCSLSPTVSPSPSLSQNSGLAIHGKAYGGQQPIVGGHVYLYTAGTSGYGNAASSLLTSAANTTEDGSGHYYVITDSAGNFSISGDYTCTTGSVAYLYLVGGNSGTGANSAIGLLAALGACPAAHNFATATPFVFMDEVSTIAAAYAMAGFATDATHVSSSSTALAATGIRNAFANTANLADISTGLALDTTPAGNGTVPQTEINTLANILASCINSASSSSTACSTLFSNAMSAGSSGSTATDTATTAIYMAHNPAANITALYDLGTPTPPFAPALGSQPNDFTIAINFTGGGMNVSDAIAIDGSGNAWAANYTDGSVSKFSSTGAVVSGSPFAGGTSNGLFAIAIDGSGNVWVPDMSAQNVIELDSTGTAVLGSPFASPGIMYGPDAVAIDGSGNAWIADRYTSDVTELDSTGATVTGSPFASVGGNGVLHSPFAIAIDGSGNVWVPDNLLSNVTKLTSAGAIVSGSPFSGGGLSGLNGPWGIAIDGFSNVWFTNNGSSSATELTSTGAAVSGSDGYTGGGLAYGPTAVAIDGSGNAWFSVGAGDYLAELSNAGTAISGTNGYGGVYGAVGSGVAIDGSGNVWVVSSDSMTEFIGAATPVVTPMAANLISPYSAPASKP